MQYKTIVLSLLEQRPDLYEQLRQNRLLLQVLEACSMTLKSRHETWKETLAQKKPGSDPRQIASEAMELALAELEHMPSAIPEEEDTPLSLDAAMASLSNHTPPA
jgi:hypothetical protein